MKSIGLVVVLAAVLGTVACGSSSSPDAASDDSAFTASVAGSAVNVGTDISADANRKQQTLNKSDAQQTWGVHYAGAAGDVIKAHVGSEVKGTAYIFKKVGDAMVTVRQADVKAGRAANMGVTLKTSGDFVLAFKPAYADHGVSHTLVKVTFSGQSAADTNAAAGDTDLGKKARRAYEAVDNSIEDIAGIEEFDDSQLRGAAQKFFKEMTKDFAPDYAPYARKFEIEGKTVYAIEDDNDGGMYISFYDKDFNEIASASCSESGEFQWDDASAS